MLYLFIIVFVSACLSTPEFSALPSDVKDVSNRDVVDDDKLDGSTDAPETDASEDVSPDSDVAPRFRILGDREPFQQSVIHLPPGETVVDVLFNPQNITEQDASDALVLNHKVPGSTEITVRTNQNEYVETINVEFEIRDLKLGSNHGCLLTAGGYAHCWGNNSVGQTGGDDANSTNIQPLRSSEPIEKIFADFVYSCAVGESGQSLCWGGNPSRELSDEPNDIQAPTKHDDNVNEVSLGNGFSCVIRNDGGVFCRGVNTFGQTGPDDQIAGSFNRVAPFVGPAIQMSSSTTHSCAVSPDTRFTCWGSNGFGALRTIDGTQRIVPSDLTPRREKIIASNHGSCALTDAGAVCCWGEAFPGYSTGDGGDDCANAWTSPAGEYIDIKGSDSTICAMNPDRRVDCRTSNPASLGETSGEEIPNVVEGITPEVWDVSDNNLCWVEAVSESIDKVVCVGDGGSVIASGGTASSPVDVMFWPTF